MSNVKLFELNEHQEKQLSAFMKATDYQVFNYISEVMAFMHIKMQLPLEVGASAVVLNLIGGGLKALMTASGVDGKEVKEKELNDLVQECQKIVVSRCTDLTEKIIARRAERN